MTIKTGIDIVYLPRFRKVLERGGEAFLKRVFLEDELVHLEGGIALHLRGVVEHFAGIFAAKEAVMKALDLPKDSWQDIQVVNEPDGTPLVKIPNSKFQVPSSSLSISHNGQYVIAQFVALLLK